MSLRVAVDIGLPGELTRPAWGNVRTTRGVWQRLVDPPNVSFDGVMPDADPFRPLVSAVVSELTALGFEMDHEFGAHLWPRTQSQEVEATGRHNDVSAHAGLLIRGTLSASEDFERIQQFTQQREYPIEGIWVDPEVRPAQNVPAAAGGNAWDSGDVYRRLDVSSLGYSGVPLPGTGVALAIVDAGVNLRHLERRNVWPCLSPEWSWSRNPYRRPGCHAVGHGTAMAFDALIAAPHATIIDAAAIAPVKWSSGKLLTDVFTAFLRLVPLLRQRGDQKAFNGVVISNSWMVPGALRHADQKLPPKNRYFDNRSHFFNTHVSACEAMGADIVFAAGNCGPHGHRCSDCDGNTDIAGANALPEVLTVSAVELDTTPIDSVNRGSGVFGVQKPDLSAFTHFIGSGVSPRDIGTSAACAVAAGVVAGLRTYWPTSQVSPSEMRACLRASAVPTTGGLTGGHSDHYGAGIINFARANDDLKGRP